MRFEFCYLDGEISWLKVFKLFDWMMSWERFLLSLLVILMKASCIQFMEVCTMTIMPWGKRIGEGVPFVLRWTILLTFFFYFIVLVANEFFIIFDYRSNWLIYFYTLDRILWHVHPYIFIIFSHILFFYYYLIKYPSNYKNIKKKGWNLTIKN